MSIFMKSNEISDPINVGRDRAFAVTTCDHVTVNRLKKWGLEFRHDSDSVRSRQLSCCCGLFSTNCRSMQN